MAKATTFVWLLLALSVGFVFFVSVCAYVSGGGMGWGYVMRGAWLFDN